MTADGVSSYGEFVFQDVRYVVTPSAGPHTVNVYEVETTLMVCSVRDPLGVADPQWGREWASRAEPWRGMMLNGVAHLMRPWRATFERRRLHPQRRQGGAR